MYCTKNVHYCTITTVNNKEYMPQSREFSFSLLVWNIVTSTLNELMSLMGSWPFAGYSLLYPCIFALQVAQQLVGTQFLLLQCI